MKIGEVSKKYNVSIESLRYYEQEGLLGTIVKNKSGIREYSDDDLKKIEFILCMRNAEMPIQTLKKYLKLYYSDNSSKEDKKEIINNELNRINDKIKNLKNAKEILEGKIDLINQGKI